MSPNAGEQIGNVGAWTSDRSCSACLHGMHAQVRQKSMLGNDTKLKSPIVCACINEKVRVAEDHDILADIASHPATRIDILSLSSSSGQAGRPVPSTTKRK